MESAFAHIHDVHTLSKRITSLLSILSCTVCFYCVCVCLPAPHSLQTASLKLVFFSSHSSVSAVSLSSLPVPRSQSLRDGPVSSWFWTQWRRLQSQKPLGPRAQRNSKRHQPVPSSSSSCIPAHWSHIWFLQQIHRGPQITEKPLDIFFSPTAHIYYTVRPYRAQDLWAD